MWLLTFFAVQACVAGRAHTLAVDAAATILALKVAVAHVFHHLTALTCGVTYQSGVRGERSEVRFTPKER